MPRRIVVRPDPAASDAIRRGESIARQGSRDPALPACAACHDSARELLPLYPLLNGQPSGYLAQQLRLFRAGIRAATPAADVMANAAHQLSDADIAAVSAYYEQTP
jgi:cytochrome c553